MYHVEYLVVSCGVLGSGGTITIKVMAEKTAGQILSHCSIQTLGAKEDARPLLA